ncbi:MAG: hypothetical protein HY321_21785 [Armatimonadetes bacterium]|nr:hypothetical protein [Armatimonadota bacterium]
MQEAGQALQEAQQQLAAAGQKGSAGGAQALAGGDGTPAGNSPRTAVAAAGRAAGPEAGHGTTGTDLGHTGQMGTNSPKIRQSGERSGAQARFESIYAPKRVASRRLDTQVKGKRGQGKSDYTTLRGAPDPSSASRPYYDVYASYQRVAEDALSKEDVPATYKKQVRDYFNSLRPGE